MSDPTRIGVLAVQGNFREHAAMLRRLGVGTVEVRRPKQLDGLDGLVVLGGESTAIHRLMRIGGLEEPAGWPSRRALRRAGWGMILFDRAHLGLLDVEVARNAFGRQVASFEADVDLEGEPQPVRGVFIRAPRIVDAGPAVEVLGRLAASPCSYATGGCWRRRSIRAHRRHAHPRALSSCQGGKSMSGHSKWSSIKHKKGAADARGKLFSKLTRDHRRCLGEGA